MGWDILGFILPLVAFVFFAINAYKQNQRKRSEALTLYRQQQLTNPNQVMVARVDGGIIESKYQAKVAEAQNQVRAQRLTAERMAVDSQKLVNEVQSIQTAREEKLLPGQAEALNFQQASNDIQVEAKLKEAEGLARIEFLKEQKKAELATKLAYQHKVRPELGAVDSLQEKLDKLIDERERLKLDKPLGWEDKVAIRQKTIDALMEQLANTHKQLNA